MTRKLEEAARLLRSRFGAKEVWLFGSLAWGGVRPESDVDIAVAGFGSDRYFEALADLADIFGASVDLVEIEKAPASLRHLIESQGRRL